MPNILDVLHERGFVQQISDEDQLRRRLEQPITLYWGYDATADSLTQGHLFSIMMLTWFQRFGHRVIALAGGGTTMIGDPSGRVSSRPMLSEEEIDRNLAGIRVQLERFFDFSAGRALALNNADWLKGLSFMGFMRDIGSRFSVNEILRLEAYRTRLEAGGLTFLELSYVLVQSYDFLHLYKEYDAILQVGGSDQWGNSIAGADLIRRVTGAQAFVLAHPLIMTTTGEKMGKSQAGALWLTPERTSPYEYYQQWRNMADSEVQRLLGVYTFLPMEEVRTLGSLPGAELNRAKEVLAFEATKLLHGEEAAEKAQSAARALFGGTTGGKHIPSIRIDRERLAAGLPVTELFKDAGLVSSANEARSLITQGGLSINGDPVTDPRARIDAAALHDGSLLLSRGRKRHIRVICA